MLYISYKFIYIHIYRLHDIYTIIYIYKISRIDIKNKHKILISAIKSDSDLIVHC